MLLNRRFPEMVAMVADELSGCRNVLEVAAGTGLVTERLSQSVGEVTATDYSDEMLAALRDRIAARGITNVLSQKADALALPFPDQSFDGVVAANLLHLLPAPMAAMKELGRVVRHGGIVCVPTFAHGESLLAGAVSRILALAGFPVVTRFRGSGLADVVEKAGGNIVRSELIPGVLPLRYVAARFL